MISMVMKSSKEVFWYLVAPGEQANFEWKAYEHCFEAIKITEYDKGDAAKVMVNANQPGYGNRMVNAGLGDLKNGAYNASGVPSGSQVTAKDVLDYFNGKSWSLPRVSIQILIQGILQIIIKI